jgi:hypothetical protein
VPDAVAGREAAFPASPMPVAFVVPPTTCNSTFGSSLTRSTGQSSKLPCTTSPSLKTILAAARGRQPVDDGAVSPAPEDPGSTISAATARQTFTSSAGGAGIWWPQWAQGIRQVPADAPPWPA